jgi:hypothetical protein
MTAEIVILNRNGVALATDSAVTFSNGKIHNTSKKLFRLSPSHKIGVMVFNRATLMLIPWEIIIRDFGDSIEKSEIKYLHLEDIANSFTTWLEQKMKDYYSLNQEEQLIKIFVESFLIELGQDVWKDLNEFVYTKSSKITKEFVENCTKKQINNYQNKLKAKEFFKISNMKDFGVRVRTKYGAVIRECIAKRMSPLLSSKDDLQTVFDLVVLSLQKESIVDDYTGLVFAGYGDIDILPTCITYKIEAPLCGYPRYLLIEEEKISFEGNVASIIPLGQSDSIINVLQGRHPKYVKILNEEMKRHLKGSKVDRIMEITAEKMEKLYENPIGETVYTFPIDDLARMAETLIDLTSFLVKVSLSESTVGGPTDVAVISPVDGFIWIKEKKYFDITENLNNNDIVDY